MSIVARKIVDLDLNDLTKVDAHFGKHAQVDMEAIPDKQRPSIQETKRAAFEKFSIRGIYESFPLDHIKEDKIHMKTGHILDSSSLARAFAHSEEILLMVVSLDGYDEVAKEFKRVVEKYFVDSWATAMVINGSHVIRGRVYEELSEDGWTGTFPWSPGQHNLSMDNQGPLFEMLRPEEIGVTLNDSLLMIPQKSESMFFGIGRELKEAAMRPCDFCDLRETCPSAYSDEV